MGVFKEKYTPPEFPVYFIPVEFSTQLNNFISVDRVSSLFFRTFLLPLV